MLVKCYICLVMDLSATFPQSYDTRARPIYICTNLQLKALEPVAN